jgi:hypothetical protein
VNERSASASIPRRLWAAGSNWSYHWSPIRQSECARTWGNRVSMRSSAGNAKPEGNGIVPNATNVRPSIGMDLGRKTRAVSLAPSKRTYGYPTGASRNSSATLRSIGMDGEFIDGSRISERSSSAQRRDGVECTEIAIGGNTRRLGRQATPATPRQLLPLVSRPIECIC